MFPDKFCGNAASTESPINPDAATSNMTTATPAAFRGDGDQFPRLSVRSRNPMKDPIRTTGCGSRRHSQSGSPIKASNDTAKTTTKGALLQIHTSVRHRLEFRSEAIEGFRQFRATAYGQLFRDCETLRCWVKALQRRMQNEGP